MNADRAAALTDLAIAAQWMADHTSARERAITTGLSEIATALTKLRALPEPPCVCHLPDDDPSICPVHRPGIHALVHGCPLCGRTADLRLAAQRVVDADTAILTGSARADEYGRRLALDALAELLRKEAP